MFLSPNTDEMHYPDLVVKLREKILMPNWNIFVFTICVIPS